MNTQNESPAETNFYSMFDGENPYILPPDYMQMINQEGVALIKEEYSKLFDLQGDAISEEINTYSAITNFKMGSKGEFLDLKKEFEFLLKPVLTYLNLAKLKNNGNLDKGLNKETDYDLLKVLVYKSLLLAVDLNEAREMLKSLAFVLSLNNQDGTIKKELAGYVYKISDKTL